MRVKYFLIILAFIIIFLGCGGGGGGSGVAPSIVSGRIYGKITLDSVLASERAIIASNSEALRLAGFSQSIVFLEEEPARALYPDSDGNYMFTDLQLDRTYHVIASIKSLTGKAYKVRSEAVFVSQSNLECLKNLHVSNKDEAKYKIRLQVKDTADRPVGRCIVWLWGEEFTIDESGCYVSPLMPYAASGIMKVMPPANRELATLECLIDPSTFESETQGVSAVTLPPAGITQKKAPYVSVRVGEILSGGTTLRIYGSATDPQNDNLAYEWKTNIGSFTYISHDKSYVEWAVPSEETNAVIRFTASQVSSMHYPLLYSYAELPIKISRNGSVSFPGEIIIAPTSRDVEVVSSATAQITGDTVALYEAVASFPNDLPLTYSWEVSDGNIISGANSRRMYWRSPFLSSFESKIATMSLVVSEGIATVTKKWPISVTPFPTINIVSPFASRFYPGTITFSGTAKDYLSRNIDPRFFSWYLATSTGVLEIMQVGGADFTYDFTELGNYTLALQAQDISGTLGTFTKNITIINSLPVVTIISPVNDTGYSSGDNLEFKASVTDYEDGDIDSNDRITWYSDIDNVIGHGTSFELSSLSKGMHKIRVVATDSMNDIGSASIILWYDMPARITLAPESGAAFFSNDIAFNLRGVDIDNQPLDVSTYKWYLDDSPTPWKVGIDSFVATAMPSGTHKIKVVGANAFGAVESPDYFIEVGYPKPQIISPAGGSRFEPDSPITFTAIPPATGSLEFAWFINDDTIPVGSDVTLTTSLNIGRNRVSYRGTDYLGNTFESSVEVVVEKLPFITNLSIADGSSFFINHDIHFSADCIDSVGNLIAPSSIKWYLLDSGYPVLWKTGKSFNVSQGTFGDRLPPGSHTVRIEAIGPYGSLASESFNFHSGIEAVSIKKPLNYSSFSVDEIVDFLAVPDSEHMPIQWYINDVFKGSEPSFTSSFSASDTYIIRVVATDSANVESSARVQITVGLFPIMDFDVLTSLGNINPDGAVFFTGQDLILLGSGTNPIDGSPINSSNMSWYLYDTADAPHKLEGNYNTIVAEAEILGSLGEGYRKIELRGNIGGPGTPEGKKVKVAYLNLPRLEYSEPATGTILPLDPSKPDQSLPFTALGTPNAVEPLNFEWWLDWGRAGEERLVDIDNSNVYGSEMRLRLPKGLHYLSFVGSDSAGVVSAVTKKIVVSDSEDLQFTPNNGAVLFKDQPFSMDISGDIVPSSVEWHIKGGGLDQDLLPNGAPYNFDETSLSENFPLSGFYNITASGVNSLELMVNSTVTNRIYYGLKDAEITSPANNHRFEVGSPMNFVATPSAQVGSIRATSSAWYLDDSLIAGSENKHSLSTTASKGKHKITYTAKDSIGNSTSKEIDFYVGDLPQLAICLPNNEKMKANDAFFANTGLVLKASATSGISGNAIPANNMTWYVNGINKTVGASVYNISANLFQGSNEITLKAFDEFGFESSVTYAVYFETSIPTITDPSSDGRHYTRTNPVSNINIKGNELQAPIEKKWYVNGLLQSQSTNQFLSSSDTLGAQGIVTVKYAAVDSAGRELFTERKIKVVNEPVISFTPIHNGAVLDGYGMTLSATVTQDGDGGPEELTYDWKNANANNQNLGYTQSVNITAGSGLMVSGKNTIILTVTDSYGVASTTSHDIFWKYPIGDIDSPANESTFQLDSGAINFTTTIPSGQWYDATQNVTYSWGFVTGVDVYNVVAVGSDVSFNINQGLNTIFLRTTDSVGNNGHRTIRVISNNPPDTKIYLKNIYGKNVEAGEACIFGGKQVVFVGLATDTSSNTLIEDDSKYRWTLGGSDAGNGKLLTFNLGALATGGYDLKLTATDNLSTSGTDNINFYYGNRLASIASPLSGTTYPIGSTIEFKAALEVGEMNKIPMEWHIDGVAQGGASTNNQQLDVSTLGPGYHEVSYIGTDSCGNISLSKIGVVLDDPPTLNMKFSNNKTVQNAVLFPLSGADKVTIKGTAIGKVPGYTGIAASNMVWKLFFGTETTGTPDKTYSSLSSINLTSSDLNQVGTWTITFEATDFYGCSNSISESFYYGYSLPEITFPTNNSLFTIAQGSSGLSLMATPKPDGVSLPMKWYDGSTEIGTGYNLNKTFARGAHIVSFKGTDTADIGKSSTISFVVNEAPTVSITRPVNNGGYFGSPSMTFAGTANKCGFAGALDNSKITWYRSSTPTGTETKLGDGTNITVNADLVGTGTYYIRMVAIDDDFTPSLVGSASVMATVGVAHPQITSPASGTRFDNNETVIFIGNDLSSLSLNWSSDDSSLSAYTNVTSPTAFTRGRRTIKYSATDSNNTTIATTAQILIDTPPTFTNPPSITSPIKYSDGMKKADGSYYAIFIASEGRPLNFSVTAKNSGATPVEVASITWINEAGGGVVSGSSSNPNNFSMNSTPGSYTYSVIAEDEFGVQASTTYSFWVWDCETYAGYTGISSMLAKDNDNLLIAKNSRTLARLSRKSGADETSIDSGDISIAAESNPASITVGYNLMAIDTSGNDLYSISGNGTGGTRYQVWNTTDFSTNPDYDILTFKNTTIQNVGGFVNRSNYFFISEQSDSYVKKVSSAGSSSGTYILQSAAMNNPSGIKYADPENIYVADTANNRIVVLNSFCNFKRSFSGVTAPKNLVLSSDGKRLYVTSATKNKIYVIDTLSGNLLYSFGKTGLTPHQGQFGSGGVWDIAISGSGNLSDIYVTDRANGCIIRFRSGTTW